MSDLPNLQQEMIGTDGQNAHNEAVFGPHDGDEVVGVVPANEAQPHQEIPRPLGRVADNAITQGRVQTAIEDTNLQSRQDMVDTVNGVVPINTQPQDPNASDTWSFVLTQARAA